MLVCFSMFSEFRNTDLKYKESYTLFPRLLDILAKRLPYYVPSPTLQQIPERSSVALRGSRHTRISVQPCPLDRSHVVTHVPMCAGWFAKVSYATCKDGYQRKPQSHNWGMCVCFFYEAGLYCPIRAPMKILAEQVGARRLLLPESLFHIRICLPSTMPPFPVFLFLDLHRPSRAFHQ